MLPISLTLAALVSIAPVDRSLLAQSIGDEAIVTVNMIDRGGGEWRFDPADVSVKQGDLLRFVQVDIVPHNVEFTEFPDSADLGDIQMGPFLLQKGQTYELRIDERFVPGSYEYVCTPHAPMGMDGTLTVQPVEDVGSTR